MLVKASFAAIAVVGAIVGIRSMDLRHVYDEMYPVNGIKREVFGICHESDPTFVRAVEAHRVACNDSMPHNIALAIGWVRRGAGAASVNPVSPALEAAEQFFIRAAAAAAINGTPFQGKPIFTAVCGDPANAAAQQVAVDSGLKPAGSAGPRLALMPQQNATVGQKPLPILPLASETALPASGAKALAAGAAAPLPGIPAPQLNAPPAADLGDPPVPGLMLLREDCPSRA